MSWTISDLTDFICHHAWFEGARLLFQEKIECTCWETSQTGTPKKRRVTQSRSDLKDLNVARSFPVETGATRT